MSSHRLVFEIWINSLILCFSFVSIFKTHGKTYGLSIRASQSHTVLQWGTIISFDHLNFSQCKTKQHKTIWHIIKFADYRCLTRVFWIVFRDNFLPMYFTPTIIILLLLIFVSNCFVKRSHCFMTITTAGNDSYYHFLTLWLLLFVYITQRISFSIYVPNYCFLNKKQQITSQFHRCGVTKVDDKLIYLDN